MLRCITNRIRENGFGLQESAAAYELCGSYAVAIEYLKLSHQAVARYKLRGGEKIPYDVADYVQLAKESVKKEAKRKVIRFIEEGVNGDHNETAEVWAVVECSMSPQFAAMLLKEVIQEMSETMPAEEWDTDSVVQLAARHVYGKDAKFETILYDFEVRF